MALIYIGRALVHPIKFAIKYKFRILICMCEISIKIEKKIIIIYWNDVISHHFC